jgi:hypothetical protein
VRGEIRPSSLFAFALLRKKPRHRARRIDYSATIEHRLRTQEPAKWDRGLALLSSQGQPFNSTVQFARQRNELVAALADEILIVQTTLAVKIEEISHLLIDGI